MKYLFLEYPKCSTCQKAKQWLIDNGIDFEDRHIVENRPNVQELTAWIAQSGREIKSFFNTSGLKYKELGLKEKLPSLSHEEQIKILASDGMLIKRPMIIGKTIVLNGFKPEQWNQLKNNN